jgi:DNA-binding transcriptional regulator YdaS (Cro superfamily)
MKLLSWLKAQHGRSAELSRLIGVPNSFVSNMARGKKEIPAEHCRAIVDFTDGAVTVQELRPNDWHKYWPELAVAPVDCAGAAAENVEQGEA